jgi:hypothetical protein
LHHFWVVYPTHFQGTAIDTQDDHGVMNRDQESNFTEDTLAFWQPRSSKKLSREDAREMIENLTGFFRVLSSWDEIESSQPVRSASDTSEERSSIPPDIE